MIWVNVQKRVKKQGLGFPSLITCLCEELGVPVVRSQNILEPIDQKYLHNNCADPDSNAPVQPPLTAPSRTMEDLWGRIAHEFQRLNVRLDHHDKQFSAIHRGLTQLHQSHYDMAQHSMSGQTFF
jgi:hypothetical protein